MSLRPVGVEYITENEQQFFGSLMKSNQLLSQLSGALQGAAGAGGVFSNIMTGVFQSVGQQVAQFASMGISALQNWAMSGIQLNASMEQAQVAFTTLLGSAEEATAFLEELREFSAATPFEFPGLQDAARRLLAFKFEAQEIIPAMTAIGDAVGALGGGEAEIQRVVFGLGQMKAKGRVANEELMQLAELGIPVYQILGDAFGKSTAEIQEMVSKGLLPADEGVKVLLDGFNELYGGSMIAQSQTFNGLMSTLKDNLGLALQAFTGPTFELAKGALQRLGELAASPAFQNFAKVIGEQVASGILRAVQAAGSLYAMFTQVVGMVVEMVNGFSKLGTESYGWGQNIVGQLAAGMWNAVSYVVSILKQIAGVIRSWLQPGSPPKILPDLPEWGQGAINEYIKGMATPDMSLFSSLASTLGDAIKNLVNPNDFDQIAIGDMILGQRDAIAQAVEEYRTLGKVSDETFSNIAAASGPVGGAVEQLARSYFALEDATKEVAAAQAELNAVTQQYEETLEPLNEELKGIRDRKQEIKDAQRIAKLQEDLASGKLDEQEAELARLEIAEIQAQQQIKAVEEERDLAVDAAKAKLEAAQEQQAAAALQLSQQQQQIQLQGEQNQLIQQQIELLKRRAEEEARAAEAAAKGAGGGGGAPALGGLGAPAGGLGLPSPEDMAGQGQALDDIAAGVTNVGNAINEVSPLFESWNQGISDSRGKLDEFLASLQPFEPILTAVGAALGGLVLSSLLSLAGAFVAANAPLLLLIGASTALHMAWNADFMGIQGIVTGVMASISAVVTSVVGSVVAFWQQNGATILSTVQTQWAPVGEQISAIMALIQSIVGQVLGSVLQFWNENGTQILTTASNTFVAISGVISSIMTVIGEIISRVLANVMEFWGLFGDDIMQIAMGAFQFINGFVQTSMASLQGIINIVLALIKGDWGKAWEELKTMVGGVLRGVLTMLEGLWNMISPALSGLWEEFTKYATELGGDVVAGIVKGIETNTQKVVDKLVELAKKALAAAMDFLGIKSPSKLFYQMVGVNITLGIANGIEDTVGKVLKSMTRVLGKLTDSTVEGVEQLIDKVNSALNKLNLEQLEGRNSLLKSIQQGYGIMTDLLPSKKDIEKADKELQKIEQERLAQNAELTQAYEERKQIAAAVAAVEKGLNTPDLDPEQYELLADVYEDLMKDSQKLEERIQKLYAEGMEIDAAKKIAERQKMEAEGLRIALEQVRQYAKKQLDDAQARALEMAKTDASAAADYLAFTQGQIEKRARLSTQILKETDQERKDALQQEYDALVEQQRVESLLFAEKSKQQQEQRAKEYRDLAAAIVEGLGEGIQNSIKALDPIFAQLSNGIVEGLKKALGIKSPSELIAAEIGRPSGEGLVQGFLSAAEMLPKALDSQLKGMYAPITNSLLGAELPYARTAFSTTSSSSNSVVNEYNYSPTYGAAPRNPQQDFAIMRALQGG